MTHRVDLTQIDFETAFRIAKARGMAERARVFRSLMKATTETVRAMFSAPESRRTGC